MSYITQAVLVLGVLEEESSVQAVNAHLRKQGHEQSFGRLDTSAAGGSKVYSGQVWAAAFNYVPSDDVRLAVKAARWHDPETVFLMLNEENDTSSAEQASALSCGCAGHK